MSTTTPYLLLLLVHALMSYVTGALDKTVCKPPPVPTLPPPNNGPLIPPPMPVMPDEFETHVVMNIVTQNFTTELHQFFSYPKDHSVIEQREYGQRYYGYADYQNNEFLGILPESHTCNVTNLATNPNKFLFGYKKSTSAGAHTTTAGHILHAFQPDEDTVTIYLGQKSIRGIPCNAWYTCTYWHEVEATMNVYWYFSDPASWTPSSTSGAIPVRALVQGRRYKSPGQPNDFEHRYDFFHWKIKNLRKNYWQTPRAVSCPGRVNTKPIPGIPTQFSFVLEQVDKDLGFVSFMKEWYDKSQSMFRYQYRAGGSKADLFGNTVLNEVHDFNAGIAYVMDPLRGNCSIMPIETKSLDDRQSSKKTVRLRSALEFFFLDGVNPSYEGVKTIRGIDADTWVANRPMSFGTGMATWEWAFSTWNSEEEDESVTKEHIPVQMTMTEGQSTTYFNLYHFKRQPPRPSDFDITPCFVDRNRRVFQFGISNQYRSFILNNLDTFKQGVIAAVAKTTGLTPSRISNVKVNFDTGVKVTLELLDKAPIRGDVTLKIKQVDLKTAGDLLYNSIRTNAFQISVADGANSVSATTILTLPSQIKELAYTQTKKDKGVSTTTTAVVGVVMAVIGAGFGGGGAAAFHKKFMTTFN